MFLADMHPPASPLPPLPAREVIALDIELILQWAMTQTGHLPWSRDRDTELMFDKGLTAKPRKRPPVNWTIAMACAGLKLGTERPLPATMTPSGDAEIIIDAVKRLSPRQASLILACARAHIRPDFTVQAEIDKQRYAEPVERSKKCWQKKRTCKRPKKAYLKRWHDPTPEAICAARSAYLLWWYGVWIVLAALQGRLSRFRINGFAAPERPWECLPKNTA